MFNEPEASLHVDLVPPLARLMRKVAKVTQLIVVSHSARLIEELAGHPDCVELALEKQLGEAVAPGHDAPKWLWPER